MSRNVNIQVSIPDGVPFEYLPLLESKFAYLSKEPQSRKIKHAFVNHYGFVLKNGLLVNGCAFNLHGKEDNTFYFPLRKKNIKEFAISKCGKSLQSGE